MTGDGVPGDGVPGRRWGPEGPPLEAYERVRDPERFRGLHPAGRALLDELTGVFRVRRARFLDRGRPYAPEPGVLLVPEQAGAASFGLTFTEAPGLVPWYAGRRYGHLPFCGCDACDTTLDECLTELREFVDLVVTGGFGERLTIDDGRWWHTTWKLLGPSRYQAESSRPVDDAEAEQLLARMPDGHERWSAWARRPPTLPAERVGVDAGRDVGIVRSWPERGAWGVIDSPGTPGGCWAHYSVIDAPGPRSLLPGQGVQLEWEHADQDGYDYRAIRVVPEDPAHQPPPALT